MSATRPEVPARPRPTVFLSYASEDRRAAQRIRDALPGYGLEVWYDESELVGGDAWDQKIRRQIRECDYFMPVISAHTEARHEGYFRREWRLAVERTLDMADDHVFLLPVVIDATAETGARVPEKFRAVQWLRLADGEPTPALEAVCRRLVSGEGLPRSGDRAAAMAGPGVPPPQTPRGPAARQWPAFPREEPGQRIRFWFQVVGWLFQTAWSAFSRLPKWVRILAYAWLIIVIVSRGCTPSHERHTPRISAAQTEKLQEIGKGHSGNWTPADTAQLIAQIAKELPAAAEDRSAASAPVLAIPFAAPAADPAAQRLAGSVFTQVYGQLAIAHHGRIALADEPLPAPDASAAAQQGRAHHAKYVIYGAVVTGASGARLTIDTVAATDGSVLWTKSFPVSDADAPRIAAAVSASVPRGDGD